MGRFLCLHGSGCSGAILKWQLAFLTKSLGSSHEFVFLDGEVDCEAEPGVTDIAPAPYLCYYDSVATSQVQQAHDQVLSFIEDEGPFTGVIGFSQGSALAASILLHHSLLKSLDQPPFDFAIFFSGTLPFSPDHSLYLDILADLLANGGPMQDNDPTTASKPGDDEPNLAESQPDAKLYRSLFANFMGVEHGTPEAYFASLPSTGIGKAILASIQEHPQSMKSCRPYHPHWTQARIRVPTLHVIGRKDPYAAQAKLLYDLCSSSERKMIEHGGAHDVPRTSRDIDLVVQAATAVIERSMLVAGGMIC